MYRLVISNYEEKQKELTVENSDLRRCLRDMQKELHALISRSPPDSPSKSPVNNVSHPYSTHTHTNVAFAKVHILSILSMDDCGLHAAEQLDGHRGRPE